MMSVSRDSKADVMEAFISTSRYLDDILTIDNPYFAGTVSQINPAELQLIILQLQLRLLIARPCF